MPVVLKLCLTVLIRFIIHHKLLVWLLLFIRVTDCSIRVSRSFTRGLQPPGLLHLQYTIMIIKMIEIYNIVSQPYYYLWTCAYCIETIAPCAPLMHFCRSEKKMLCYQPCSTHYAVVWISNCLKRTSVIKVTTKENFYNKFKLSRTYHKINTFRGEQRWMGHKGGHSKPMKNALHAYSGTDKRHFSG